MYKGISTYLRISQANVGKSHLKCPVTQFIAASAIGHMNLRYDFKNNEN